MQPTTAISFQVSDVQPYSTPFPEVSCKKAVENLLTTSIPTGHREWLEETKRTRPDLYSQFVIPDRPSSHSVEACSRYHGRLLADVLYHPVVAAVHHAYAGHRSLTLSPDIIWLMICQGVANHVNANESELRPRLVAHEGRIEIEIRDDDFIKGSPENPWGETLSEFSQAVRRHIGCCHELFSPTFSTTGAVERAASEVVLLDAIQSYFRYVVRFVCGIPTITLEGTPDDWQMLADKAERFTTFGLDSWLGVLRPILSQFTEASRGCVDRSFWRSIYQVGDVCGGPCVSGWVSAFFPYLKDRETGRASMPNPIVPIGTRTESRAVVFRNRRYDTDRDLAKFLYPDGREPSRRPRGISFESWPGGLSKAPFTWIHSKGRHEMEFLGGFIGVAQHPDTMALRPEIGWVVRESGDRAVGSSGH
jgi:Domain of unknown function (DUF4419)